MDVGHEYSTMLIWGEGIGLIYAGTSMSRPMPMVSNSLDVFIDIWVKMPASLSLIDATRNDMPEMRDDTS
ncbi:MAG: hypothetical protein KDC53_23685, partial [Saprospiraceae bacterium]|nr:hypothetical protein [Saprospiraceae bacterium]